MAFLINNTVVIDNNSNVIIGSGATRPASPQQGTLWFNTSSNILEGYNGSVWITLCSLA